MSFRLIRPRRDSHKGENGKVMVIGGSYLFHGASFWALKVLTRLVDMVFFASVPEVECVVNALKTQLWDFIYIPRPKVEEYIQEAEVILIGLGMTRQSHWKIPFCINWRDTAQVTSYLIKKYPQKKWLVDAGALQVISPELLKPLSQVIITPHQKEFENLFHLFAPKELEARGRLVKQLAADYQLTILLKGEVDVISDGQGLYFNRTGNEGMTKGGTGDVLAGLVAGLWVKNPALVAARAAAYYNGLAGDLLYKKYGPFFNASDLTDKVVEVLKDEFQSKK